MKLERWTPAGGAAQESIYAAQRLQRSRALGAVHGSKALRCAFTRWRSRGHLLGAVHTQMRSRSVVQDSTLRDDLERRRIAAVHKLFYGYRLVRA